MDLRTDFPAPTAAEGNDLRRYWHHVEHLDLPEPRKLELLEAVWRIMGNFVDRAFGSDPSQLARIAGDKLDRERASTGRITIGSEHTLLTNDDGGLAGAFRRCGKGE